MITNRKLNICIIEDNITWNDKEQNLSQLENNLKSIPHDTDIVVLPELFSTGFMLEEANIMRDLAEKNTEKTIYTLKQLAKQE